MFEEPGPSEQPITFEHYAARWSRLHTIRPTTRAVYTTWLDRVWLPALGAEPLPAVTRRQVLAALDTERARGLKPGTLRCILGVLRALLADARDEGLVTENVATRVGRLLGRSERRVAPLDAAQLGRFLEVAACVFPSRFPLFLALARSGIRIGEALALERSAVDLAARELAIVQTLRADGSLGPPKSRSSQRRVDMSRQLVEVLGAVLARSDQRFVFGTARGPLAYHRARLDFGTVRDVGEFPRLLSPHSLRHTYASLLIARGVSPAYVQRQLGHSSIALTLDLYGRHVPYRDLAAVDGLDEAR